jgi:hypothetical protein
VTSPPPLPEQGIEILRQRMIRNWWLVTIVLWLTVGAWSLWDLRAEMDLWLQFFTWTAVRYSLAYNRLPALGLGLCCGMTMAVLVIESRHLIWGLSKTERVRLERQLSKIRQKGPSHPLWRVLQK